MRGVWVLPEDYCKKDPCNFNTEMFVSKVGNPCSTLGQLFASRILDALVVGENQCEIARARFCTQRCSKVGQLLVNSSPTPHPMGSCRCLPCSSALATPDLFLLPLYPFPTFSKIQRKSAQHAHLLSPPSPEPLSTASFNGLWVPSNL